MKIHFDDKFNSSSLLNEVMLLVSDILILLKL